MRKRILSLTAVIVVVLVALLGFAGSGSAAPPPPVTNYQVVTATVQVVNQSTASLTAACPTGKRGARRWREDRQLAVLPPQQCADDGRDRVAG